MTRLRRARRRRHLVERRHLEALLLIAEWAEHLAHGAPTEDGRERWPQAYRDAMEAVEAILTKKRS